MDFKLGNAIQQNAPTVRWDLCLSVLWLNSVNVFNMLRFQINCELWHINVDNPKVCAPSMVHLYVSCHTLTKKPTKLRKMASTHTLYDSASLKRLIPVAVEQKHIGPYLAGLKRKYQTQSASSFVGGSWALLLLCRRDKWLLRPAQVATVVIGVVWA